MEQSDLPLHYHRFKFFQGIMKHFNSYRVLVAGFALIDLIGAILLALPAASSTGQSHGFLNAMFTATASLCVTGLTVFPTYSSWSVFGLVIIIVLVQIGGIGFVTVLGVAFMFIGKKITLKQRLIIQKSLNENQLQGMVRLIRNVAFGTLIIEGTAAVILTARFAMSHSMPLSRAFGLGFFHAVSSFCNAGIDIAGPASLAPFVRDPAVNLITILLIVLGSLGCTVWMDVIHVLKENRHRHLRPLSAYGHLKLHTKIVLEMTALLILSGALFFFIAEFHHPQSFGNLPLGSKIGAAFFQSVSFRTTGYYTVDPRDMTMGSQFITMLLMFVGGSPASTSGGVKTVTVFVIVISVISVIRGRNVIISHQREIRMETLQSALAVVIVNITIVITGTLLLFVTERHIAGYSPQMMDYFFEILSGTSTVGLSMGITPYLSHAGKIILCFCMFSGRAGPMTVAVSLAIRQMRGDPGVHYPEERVLIG